MTRLIIGIQPVREAIRAGAERLDRVWIENRPRADASRPLASLAAFARQHGVDVDQVDRGKLDRATRGGMHQGVVAFAQELDVISPTELLERAPSLVTVLDRITDPQNFGAIVRSSVAFGADAVMWPEHANAPLTSATFRASAGAVEHATLCRAPSLRGALQQLSASGLQVIGLDGDAKISIAALDLTVPVALVVGAEGSGLRRGIRALCDCLVRLPTTPPLGTLNASVSAGVALYEVRRQRLGA